MSPIQSRVYSLRKSDCKSHTENLLGMGNHDRRSCVLRRLQMVKCSRLSVTCYSLPVQGQGIQIAESHGF